MSYSNKRKNKTMAAKNTSGNPEENDKEMKMEFEFIEESEIESVKRGRKAIVVPELVAFLTKAKVGQTVKVPTFALDSSLATAEEKKTAKAKNSATLRVQAKNAGWKKVAIIWDVNNTPFLKRTA